MSVEAVIATQVIDTTSVGRAVMTAVDAAAARTAIGLGTLATQSGTFSGTSSGTNTGDQSSVSGNAGSATILQTARTINGVSFDGSANITVTAAGSTLSDTVTVAKGGTGLTSLGTALQVLRVNAGATALEYATAGGALSGTGAVDNAVLRADGTGGATLQNSAFVIADNATASPNNTVNHASIQATGGTTNVSVSIVPKGTGAFCLQVPDSGTGGGNARGANAVDLQTIRSAATQVASGPASFVVGKNSTASGPDGGAAAIGESCIASGSRAFACGLSSTASGTFSFSCNYASIASGGSSFAGAGATASAQDAFAFGGLTVVNGSYSVGFGYQGAISGQYAAGFGLYPTAAANYTFAHGHGATANRLGMYAHAANWWDAVNKGDSQYVRFVASRKTTNNTPTTLMLDGSSTRLTITAGKVFAFTARITGIKSDGTAVAEYVRKGVIKRISNTTSLVGSIEAIGTDIEDNASTDVAITADDTNEALQINVTGIASETWRWVAVVEGIEIAYGT
jgi:hypothetical protein